MPSCPRCHQPISPNDVSCPNCGLELKAHGHPGIDLYRAESGTYLCQSCAYHQDDSCSFPKRPTATTCTLFLDVAQVSERVPTTAELYTIPWWRKHTGVLVLVALILISFALVIM